MLITKEDFLGIVPFTVLVPDSEIYPYVNQTLLFDLPEVLKSETLLDALFTLNDLKATGYDPLKEYAVNDYIFIGSVITRNAKVYKALNVSTGSIPTLENANWEYSDLYTFYYFYVRPFIVVTSFVYYKHNFNIQETPTGSRVFEDTGLSSNPAPLTHGHYINSWKETQRKYKRLLENELSYRKHIIAGIDYTTVVNNQACNYNDYDSIGINAI